MHTTRAHTADDVAILSRMDADAILSSLRADRKDAALMHSAQRYDNARAIATMGKPESEAIQVR